jgi:hypothetical protein
LSGFIEAEGNFSLILRKTGSISKCSFNIGQNDDKGVLNLIKIYLNCPHISILEDKKLGSLRNHSYKHYRICLSGS